MFLALVAALLLAGCGTATEPTIAPTVTIFVPTSTPLPPTNTVPPPPTALPAPTDTPPPTLTPTPTDTPTITPIPAPNALVAPGLTSLRLRAQPSTDGAELLMMNEYTPMTVIGRSSDAVWLQVVLESGNEGWVMAQYVQLGVDINTVAVTTGAGPVVVEPTAVQVEESSVEDTAPQGPAVENPTGARVAVGRGGLRLRSAPEQDGTYILGNLEEGAPLTLTGRTADNLWLRVSTTDGLSGWVWASYVELSMDINQVSVVSTAGGAAAPAPTAVAIVATATTVPAVASATPVIAEVLAASATPTPQPVATRTTVQPTAPAASTTVPPTSPPPPTNTAQPVAVAALPADIDADAVVADGVWGLRVRSAPNVEGAVLGSLEERTPLILVESSADGHWLHVRTGDGLDGWVWGDYVTMNSDVSPARTVADAPPPTAAPQTANLSAPASNAAPSVNVVSGISGHARQIYEQGQALGNRANVFSKVGDSITVATYYLYSFGWGTYDLGNYGSLQPALNYFSAAIARDGNNSFANISLAADNGWTTRSVLNPALAAPGVCQSGETPLECEYRVVRPAVALIMLGSNDVREVPAEEYQANLSRIVEISIARGVIPVLSTIPPYDGHDDLVNMYNQIIIGLARGYDVPLWDYWGGMLALPNRGLSADGLHPSWAPGNYGDSAVLSPQNLNYGYVYRNFSTLAVLDAIWRQVLY